jgi:hypothetical protein
MTFTKDQLQTLLHAVRFAKESYNSEELIEAEDAVINALDPMIEAAKDCGEYNDYPDGIDHKWLDDLERGD